MPVTVLSIQPHAVRGGPAILHLLFLESLSRLGHEVHAVVPETQEMLPEYRHVARSVACLRAMPCVPRTTAPLALARYALDTAAMARRIARRAGEVRADVVHTFNEAFPAGGIGARLARLPSVVQIIGMSIFQPPWVARAYVRMLDASADRLVGCQQAIRRELLDLGVDGSKVAVVYNAVDAASVRERALLSPPPREPGTVRVGMVAGMDPRKGHLDFVAAAARVLRVVPAARFFIVGSTAGNDAYHSAVREQIARHGLDAAFRFTGMLERPEPWIASFDVHCIPSRSEALSGAGLEAMALGRPIVATRVGGNPEAVVDGETGLLSAVADPEDLADKLIRLLTDEELRTRMGAAARRRVDDMFGIERNAGLLGEVLEQARTM